MIANIVVYLKNDWRSRNRMIHTQDITLNLSTSLTSPYYKSNYYAKSLKTVQSRQNIHITEKFYLVKDLLSG